MLLLFYSACSYNGYKQKHDEELLMSKIQVESSCPSSATHHLTQSSTTLNRRYVHRPSNIAIEEAAKTPDSPAEEMSPQAVSRLVNLRVSAAELEAARAREEAERMAENERISQNMAVYPAVVEFGGNNATNVPEPTSTEATTSTLTPEIDTATLAMNIAADYAAASLGASVKEYGNNYDAYAMNQPAIQNPEIAGDVDAIARAASEAIATIRVATEPSQVSEQVASLKAFADNIKANPGMPEMKELGDTIEKFVNIAMKSTKVQEETKASAAPKVTLSSKATRAAAKVTKSSAKVMAANNRAKMTPVHAISKAKTPMRMANGRKVMPMTNAGVRRPAPIRKASPEELKNRAIEQALHSVATMDEPKGKSNRRPMVRTKKKGSALRFAVAFCCAAACVVGIISFVGSNMPDISVRVAAMQTGIEASYPSYIPRDYSLSDISSEDGKITLTFAGPDNSSFVLVEEKSSWDSSALLRNYVEPTWEENYATTHEQGITIYIANDTSDAAWVNGGVLYKITSSGTALTKKQVRSIVTSL